MKIEFYKNYINDSDGIGYAIEFLPAIGFLKDIYNYRAIYLNWLIWGIKIEF